MLTRRTLLFGAGALTGCSRLGEPVDFTYSELAANRSAWGRVHHLAGDSIFRGNAIGVYADLATPATPLYRFRSISSMANWAMEASRIEDRFVYMFPIRQHGNINPSDIRAYIARGVIRPSDTVTLEDAGDHNMDPNSYEAFWAAARAAVSDRQPVTSVMMDMFEFPAGANLASNVNCQYETPFHGRTMNAATRAAATAPRNYPGRTLLIPMRNIANQYRAGMLAAYGLDPFSPDGVHMRVWAQMKMAGVLCNAVGARVTNVDPLIEYAIQNLSALTYGSTIFDAAAAELCCRNAFISASQDASNTQ